MVNNRANRTQQENKEKINTFSWQHNLNKGHKINFSVLMGVAFLLAVISTSISCNKLGVVNFYSCSWNDIAIRCNKLETGSLTEDQFIKLFKFNETSATSLEDFIGKERTVNINGLDHRVRIIDTKHDVDKDDKKLTFTFEFANVISDDQGNSLAYQWNDTNNISTANVDFINSTIRFALTGEGTNGGKQNTERNGEILVAQKKQTKWSETYKNKTIISMLPKDLVNALKSVKKTVGIKTATSNDYDETSYTDKLFMLSGIEMGFTSEYDRGYGSKYKYYDLDDKPLLRTRVVKKQLNNSEIYTNPAYISKDSGQLYKKSEVNNRAGQNSNTESTGGSIYWSRSPFSQNAECSWCFMNSGIMYADSVANLALGVAPAFCL